MERPILKSLVGVLVLGVCVTLVVVAQNSGAGFKAHDPGPRPHGLMSSHTSPIQCPD
jgi:hypothetical protein